jgi:hypothetical protein
MRLMLSEKIAPFLQDADVALAENERLRESVKQLEIELNASQSELHSAMQMQDRMSDYIASLERDLAANRQETMLLKARMKMFGEAANIIISEVSKQTEDAYKPKTREAFVPSDDLLTRPVRPLDGETIEQTSAALAFLSNIK